MWHRSASFILDKNQNDTVYPADSVTLTPPPPSISTPQNPNPNLDRNMSMSAYYQTRAAHHGVVTSDWLAQSQEAATRAVATSGQEIVEGGKSGRAFSVIDEFNNWRKQPDLAEAVAAIRALAAVIRNSEAKTMMELEIELKKASDSLKVSSIIRILGNDLFVNL